MTSEVTELVRPHEGGVVPLTTPAVSPALDGAAAYREPRRWDGVVKFARRKPIGAVSIVLLLSSLVVTMFAEQLAPYSPEASGLGESFAGPSLAHPFGLDQLGRDVLSRVIAGGRISYSIGLTSTAIALAAGISLGVASAYFGGLFDLLVQRAVEILNVFPNLILALLLVAMFGQTTFNIIVALSISMAPGMARMVRASVISVRGLPYVQAAQGLGASDLRIMARHILPNIGGSIMVMSTLAVGGAITAEAGLAFIGIGGSPGDASWGRMLSDASSEFIRYAPHLAYFPGIAITSVVLAINLAGDALRDQFDPRARVRTQK